MNRKTHKRKDLFKLESMPMKLRTVFLAICVILTLSMFNCLFLSATPWTPFEWQDKGKLRDWVRDQNRNFVDDLIEAEKGQVDIIVDLNGCIGSPSESAIVQYLNTVGDVTYVGKYLSFVIVKGVDVQQAVAIAKRPEVAMVELNVPLKWLDIERQAMKVQGSNAYSDNLTKKGWHGSLNGSGINIAILDSGVDNNHSELKGRYQYAYNAMTRKFEDPPGISDGHGTWMARIALGTGDYGIAPGAGLVDIKIGDEQKGGTVAELMDALEIVLDKQKDWNIRIVNLSVGFNLAPPDDKNDGKEALSWLVNRVVASGIVVVAAAGNGPTQNDEEIKPPGTASWAITVGAADPGNSVDRNDDVITFSTHGPRVDDGDQDEMDELKPELVTSSCCGSSPAAARTSGLAALLLQIAPDINPGSLKDLLIRTAEDIDQTTDTTIVYPKDKPTWDKKWGFGLVDAFEAVNHLEDPNAPDLTFKGYDGTSHPNSPWYYSHSVKIEREGKEVENIIAKEPHTIYARVWNKSSQAEADNVRVNFAFYHFTAGISQFHDIGSDFISTIKANGIVEASIDWTPPELPTGQEHGCILVIIEYGYDSNFSNMSNFAQRNIQVKPTSSPVTFTFYVENPFPSDARIDLFVTTDYNDWTVKLSESSFVMAPHDCARTICATVEPPVGAAPGTEALFFVTAYGRELGQEQSIEIGGVALKAHFKEKAVPSAILLGTISLFCILAVIAIILYRKQE